MTYFTEPKVKMVEWSFEPKCYTTASRGFAVCDPWTHYFGMQPKSKYKNNDHMLSELKQAILDYIWSHFGHMYPKRMGPGVTDTKSHGVRLINILAENSIRPVLLSAL